MFFDVIIILLKEKLASIFSSALFFSFLFCAKASFLLYMSNINFRLKFKNLPLGYGHFFDALMSSNYALNMLYSGCSTFHLNHQMRDGRAIKCQSFMFMFLQLYFSMKQVLMCTQALINCQWLDDLGTKKSHLIGQPICFGRNYLLIFRTGQ